MPSDVALADHGTAVITAKRLASQHVSVHAAGTSEPVFTLPSDPSDTTRVAGAAYAPLAVRAYSRRDPVTRVYASHLELFETHGDGGLLWSAVLPVSSSRSWVGATPVEVSRDGSRIAVAAGDVDGDRVVFQSFDRAGALLRSRAFVGTEFVSALDADAAAARVAMTVGSTAYVYDSTTDVVELQTPHSPSGDLAISADGQRLALGSREFVTPRKRGVVEVLERDAAGAWASLLRRVFPFETEVTHVAVDATGSRVAFVVKHVDHTAFDVHLVEVDTERVLFVHTVENVASFLQIHPTALRMDDRGRTVGVTQWGDSARLTPEVLVLDEHGQRLVEFNSRGSALVLALTPEGDRFAAGATSRHMNSFSNRGDVYYGRTRREPLAYTGMPRGGETLTFDVRGELAAPGPWAVVVATELALERSPWGFIVSPPHIIRTFESAAALAGRTWTVPLGLAGVGFHLQAVDLSANRRPASGVLSLRVVR